MFLYRLDADRRVLRALRSLEGTLTEKRMIQLNAVAERTSDYSKAAALYFHESVQSPDRFAGLQTGAMDGPPFAPGRRVAGRFDRALAFRLGSGPAGRVGWAKSSWELPASCRPFLR